MKKNITTKKAMREFFSIYDALGIDEEQAVYVLGDRLINNYKGSNKENYAKSIGIAMNFANKEVDFKNKPENRIRRSI